MDDLRENAGTKANHAKFTSLHYRRNLWTGDAILDNDLVSKKKNLVIWCYTLFFYAKIGSETKDFDIADVCTEICEKLIHRHPSYL
jgi:XTP/dITP diphosphohydrolase